MQPTTAGASELRILVVDDEQGIRTTLAMALELSGHAVTAVGSASQAVDEVTLNSFHLAFVDLRLGPTSGLDLIPRLLALSPGLRIVVITAFSGIDTAVEAMRRGAFDYLPKPFTPGQIDAVVRRIAEIWELERRVSVLKGDIPQNAVELDSRNAAMSAAVDLARQVATSDATIMIRGESGTGKGVLARAIHDWSDRGAKGKPLATVSCPSLSAELLESELFGHVRGAFTGALRDHAGRIEMAAGGTLFLDEVGDLPVSLQPKLLRFIQEREYERVGDTRTRRADVRLITATNVDLEDAVRNGRFREDLLYRLNVIQITLPPLRDRVDDIVPLAEHFLVSLRRDGVVSEITAEAKAALQTYRWPGNVRELRNVIERATILCKARALGVEYLPAPLSAPGGASVVGIGDLVALERVEELHIRRVIARTASLDEAADVLQIDSATLWRKRKKFGL